MSDLKRWNGLILVIFAAVLGAWLLVIPGLVIQQYQEFQELGAFWGGFYLTSILLGSGILAGVSGWILFRLWARKRKKLQQKEKSALSPSQLSNAEKASEIDNNLLMVQELESADSEDSEFQAELSPLIEAFKEKQDGSTLEIVAFGTISSGKSALLNLLANREAFQSDVRGGTTIRRSEIPWPGKDQVILVDTPGLGEIQAQERLAVTAEAAENADLILLVVDGPIRSHEFVLLEQLVSMEKPVLVCLNKIDWFSLSERELLLGQVEEQLKGKVAAENILLVQAQPVTRIRTRISNTGDELEEQIEEPADIEKLSERMMELLSQSGKDFLLSNLLLQSRGLVEKAKEQVQARLDRQAKAVVEKYMWGAAGAAAISPFPVVDLISGCAISSKMVIDLGRIYRQEMDLDSAVSLLGQLGKNLIGILGASAATPAVSSIFASLLKTVPGVGTIAGGLLQGCVQAIVTRWIGLVFIEYFRSDLHDKGKGLTTIARQKWKELTTIAELRSVFLQAKSRDKTP